MNCSKCGAQNIDGVTFCGSCGSQMESHIPQTPQQHNFQTPQQSFQNEGGSGQQQYHQQPYNAGQQGNMYAPNGGSSNGGMVPPKNYMVESIIVTIVSILCCCSPISVILGIIAIVKASNVNTNFEFGNINEAISNADSAKKLTIWAAAVAVAFVVIVWMSYFVFVATTMAELGGLDAILDNL